jgi:adenylate kinase
MLLPYHHGFGSVTQITAKMRPIPYLAKCMATESKNDRAAWLYGPAARCSAAAEMVGVPWRLVLLGAPGVGKGTQADLLHGALGACHLSTGDVFRAASSWGGCELSPAMKAAVDYMRRGALVPDGTVWEMVTERKGCLHCGGGFILDGFPRTVSQAELLKLLMENEGPTLTAVVNYDLPLSEIVARLSGRRTCESCKTVFHVATRPPKVAGVCDHCGGKLLQREDDRPASIEVRMEAYNRSTTPLIEFYRKLGLLLSISAAGFPEDICGRTLMALTAWRARNAV